MGVPCVCVGVHEGVCLWACKYEHEVCGRVMGVRVRVIGCLGVGVWVCMCVCNACQPGCRGLPSAQTTGWHRVVIASAVPTVISRVRPLIGS